MQNVCSLSRSTPDLPSKAIKRHLVRPGEHYVTGEPMMLTTLLGSCVSVCLFDPVVHLMGMNHFLLPMRNPASGALVLASDAGRYGLWAMEILINEMLSRGARRERLRAKAFGGGNVLQEPTPGKPEPCGIGMANVNFVRQFLKNDGIPLVSHDLGGLAGRQIHFYGGDYSVYLRRIPRASIQRIQVEERQYLQRAIVAKQQSAPADFF
jgi:chemotaxis protein CheD